MTGSTTRTRLLHALQPAGHDTRPARWQQQKRARTRLRIIEAAIDCRVGGGYSGLTAQAVAERTGVSRGAVRSSTRWSR
ncbi:MAG: TetR/AcrR family transcriptional regulator [Novosphingobium sp.]|nr:TetR/AcrR family transcriptional regulator [Novosphingobium sp.]